MRIFKCLILFLTGTLLMFLICAFVEGNFDVSKWNRAMKGFVGFMDFIIFIISIGVYADKDIKL